MIGQEKLLNKFNNMNSLDDIPKSIILYGLSGSGRHTAIKELFGKFFIDIIDVDFELSLDILNDMYSLSIPTAYIIDINRLSEHKRIERFQNTILKFLEEPPKFAWVVILAETPDSLLYTIKNRCTTYFMSNYSIEELRQISDLYNKNHTDNILKLLKTPKNIIEKDISQFNELSALSQNMINSIGNATPANALSIRNKFFKEENYLDLDLFLDILSGDLFTAYRTSNYNQKYFEAYLLTIKFKKDLRVLGINKKYLLDNFLVSFKEIYARYS